MENQKKLNRWLLDHHKELGLKATQVTWVKEWLPGFYDFQVSLSINNKTHIGRGLAENMDLAFTKAGAEAIERAICVENSIGSCGVAVHTYLEKAQLNAKNELIERDRFFCHYLTKTPFQKINIELAKINLEYILAKLNSYGVDLQFFKMTSLNKTKSVVCISKGISSGLVLGLGASENIDIAAKKAFTECLTNTVAAINQLIEPLSLDDFYSKQIVEPDDHRRLYSSTSKLIEQNSWIYKDKNNRDNIKKQNPEFAEESSFKYEILNSNHKILKNSPLTAIRCKNPHFQKSFYGEFDKKYINLNRLQVFSNNPIELNDLNLLPHPLG
ncbi:MAG: hypothetical protein HOO06_14450 [Bdellovibrionaceae bacterium]|jgi:ribosomal protein S12 methylthiotransferase accessory factor YcaO|nr:hypothetical protein [Pseudobdellovibrionaceae bacterium]